MPPDPGKSAARLPPPGEGLESRDFPALEFLRTPRLVMRGLAYRHALDVLQLGLDARVERHLLDGQLNKLVDVVGLVVWVNRLYGERPGLGIWHTADDRSGAFVGIFSLMPEPDCDEIGIGTRLLPRYWGRGYALEGGVALCEHAFGSLHLPSLVGLCAPDNRSVPPLLARLGFVPDGEASQCGKPALRFVLRREDWRGVVPRMRRPSGRN